ncbi:NUDIX hydrolase [Nocardioides pocheonensis]|uniref:NUDIX domain-containing protein n=1 Tax=Nocardioides pocheonensis TaxID=661485 RepID=A0A3N0GTW7_9ACTN|nr:NUDIX domain-containing protein [Nocardioides pocheonensis]RNM15859.1 NUDIX domain-containing protein [Nocardioides pocheonensis]
MSSRTRDGGPKPEQVPDEQVALVHRDGHVLGGAPRSVVRRDNLLHSATAVLVRDGSGHIYVHRRSDSKDWAPAHWDAAAGGVIVVGEEPEESAVRELGEELGITGVPLRALVTHLYQDEGTRCFEHAFEAVWSGPVRHQPEEVAEGRWMTLGELAGMLADPSIAFVPDTRQLLGRLADAGIGDYGTLASPG